MENAVKWGKVYNRYPEARTIETCETPGKSNVSLIAIHSIFSPGALKRAQSYIFLSDPHGIYRFCSLLSSKLFF